MKLSIVIPVYNEEKTIGQVLRAIASLKIAKITIEIIVVDDGSTDATASVISNISSKGGSASGGKSQISNLKSVKHKNNQGKGAAVRTGINNASGEYIIIQDADLEYHPSDIEKLIRPILDGQTQVIYGTRLRRWPDLSRDEKTFRFLLHYFGNRLLSLLTSLLYGQWLTDMETGYKLFPKSALAGITLRAKSFDFEPEITAKLLKKGYKIMEVPISTNPRGYAEGKKLNTIRDGVIALWTLIKFRFLN